MLPAIENRASSAPPLIEKVSVWGGRSASVAVTVKTPVVFSGTLAVSAEVITGSLSLPVWFTITEAMARARAPVESAIS